MLTQDSEMCNNLINEAKKDNKKENVEVNI